MTHRRAKKRWNGGEDHSPCIGPISPIAAIRNRGILCFMLTKQSLIDSVVDFLSLNIWKDKWQGADILEIKATRKARVNPRAGKAHWEAASRCVKIQHRE